METKDIQKIEFGVESATKSASQAEISVRNFKVLVDEPELLGGTDEAPNPVEYILCGLTGCMHILAFNTARELNMELSDMKIKVSGELDPSKMFGMPTDERAGYQKVAIELHPETTANQETLGKWKSIMAERSPVLDNLFNQTPVEIKLG